MAKIQTYPPFTFEHFMQAVHSLRNEPYMYYIDEAVAIYCRLRGRSVGNRPASSKDYSPEYADAFEAANYAVFIVSGKISSFDPLKGSFKSYLDTALENALKDILKADGRSDFFDQTSKKKDSDPEPERHRRVDADRFRGAVETDSEPDSASSDRDERIRKHIDDALETMIKFIDSLPDMKRAAIYASAFGQALRPDLDNYGRNYADILADKYGTTALYIRQLATEGKRAALEQARKEGFNEGSMTEVSMGYLQSGKSTEDPFDKVLEAVSKLSPYQQFMLLRHLAGTVEDFEKKQFKINKINSNMSIWGDIQRRGMGVQKRKEDDTKEQLIKDLADEINEADKRALPTVFPGKLIKIMKSVTNQSVMDELITVEDNSKLLSEEETLLLKACALLPFTLGKYTSIDDILTSLEVKVIIDPGKPKRAIPPQLLEAQKLYGEWEGMAEDLEAWKAMKLRGLYDTSDKIIQLFPNNMKDEYDGEMMKELLVSTLAHEAMHAYFDRPPRSNSMPYVICAEEPLAEFGMLLFLHETKLRFFLQWARHDVRSTRTCYRYGDALMSLHLDTADNNGDSLTRRDLERYKFPVF